jgi:predicted pyridoxine 5'-phosphate oxidase superfamily flavin-nucleotide-binding protein
MISKEAKELIENNPVAIATCALDNPDVAVVADVKVVSENQLLIGDNYLTKTVTNITKNHKVVLAVWNRNWEDDCFGYKMTGRASYSVNDIWHNKVKEIHAGFPAKGAVLVTVENIKRIGD